jgi:Methyltransferase domain
LARAWLEREDVRQAPHLGTREELWQHVAEQLTRPLTFWELGVSWGESLRAWAKLLSHPQTRLVGFNTFQGLPEQCNHGVYTEPVGAFSTGGRIPEIADSRVECVVGLFQETLPRAVERPKLIHFDADIYSATLYALATTDPSAGAALVFDDFNSMLSEFRALADYCSAWRREYEVIGLTTMADHVALRMQS